MLDNIIWFILRYTYIIIGVIFLVKAYLFIRHRNKNWRFTEFFYFNQVNIKYTSTAERAKLKRIQNILSVVILTLLIVQLLSIVLVPA